MRHDHNHEHPHRHDHDETRGRGGRHRARRGAIVNATLMLLDERPMHGYELITELDARSDGRWRPSPGTMYPALGRMEKHGLVESVEIDDKKQFRLTEAGRQRLAEYRATREDDTEPWNDTGRGHRGELRGHVSELVGQVRQIGRFGTADQIERAGEVLVDAKRSLYAILASESSTPGDAGSSDPSLRDGESGDSAGPDTT